MIYDYSQPADNPTIRIDAKYDRDNVRLRDGTLQLIQKGYSEADLAAKTPVSMAGIQSRRLDIIHGTFRSVFKVKGSDGGSCASFFWYRNDASEIDIEAVTRGTSLVSNTLSYTTQPSVHFDGTPIPNATFKIPLSPEYNSNVEIYHEHRFDCDLATGVKYYLDGQLKHFDVHNIPNEGGNLQMKLWADGNRWWSGHPSRTSVTMSVKSIIAYFNTSGTEDGTDLTWFDACQKAGGPSNDTICTAYAQTGRDDDVPLASSHELHASTSSPKATGLSACHDHPSGWLCSIPPQRNQVARLRSILAYGRSPQSRRVAPCFTAGCASYPGPKRSQGKRPTSSLMNVARAITDYLPGGHLVQENQAFSVSLPSWFSLDYARNSSAGAAYKYLASARRGNVRRSRSRVQEDPVGSEGSGAR